MMFFHRHKGDLGEIHREPRKLHLSGSYGKQEGKGEREQPMPIEKKEKLKKISARDTIFTPEFHMASFYQRE